MAENWVRCPGCHEVFDAEAGPCPKCGVPWKAPARGPQPFEGLYSERYAEPVETPLPVFRAAPKPPRKLKPEYIMGAGAILVISALVVGLVMAFGGGSVPKPTAPPGLVRAADTSTPLTPSQAPIVGLAYGFVDDRGINAHIVVDTTLVLNAAVQGKALAITTHFDGHLSAGNESGTVKTNGVSQEIRLVDGDFFSRPPGGKWAMVAAPPLYLEVSPIFSLAGSGDLKSVGATLREGQTSNHLQSTTQWIPDLSRVAMTDISALPIKPNQLQLDLWVTDLGIPISATISATNTDPNGAKLLDIEIAYAFSDVGTPTTVVAPMSPLPSPSATPGS
jgi:hypothetical protein